jgi:hypothetical protein
MTLQLPISVLDRKLPNWRAGRGEGGELVEVRFLGERYFIKQASWETGPDIAEPLADLVFQRLIEIP